jgi:hypothetical protein
MKHINYKIGTLLHEGFSIRTLENFSNKQIDLLYEKIKKEKEVEEQLDTVVKKADLEKPETRAAIKELPPGTKVTIETEVTEKSVSKKQQKAMGIALSAKRGDIPKSELKGASKEMVKMSEKNLKDFASTKHKGLPEKKTKSKKSEVKKLEENILNLVQNHLPPHTTKEELLRVIKSYKR